MANYLYNGVELPELPAGLENRVCYIARLNGKPFLYWYPAGCSVRTNPTTMKTSITFPDFHMTYGRYFVKDGAWAISYTKEIAQTTLTYLDPLDLIWTKQDIVYFNNAGIHMAATEPVPAPGTMASLEPPSLIQGWIMGRKAGRSRRPQ